MRPQSCSLTFAVCSRCGGKEKDDDDEPVKKKSSEEPVLKKEKDEYYAEVSNVVCFCCFSVNMVGN